MLISLILLLAACGEPDNNPNPADGGTTEDGGTWDGGTEDGGTDTGTGDGGGGNCGGPEPPEDRLWICKNEDTSADYVGYTWPIAGGPEDLDDCTTTENWSYEIDEDGNFATLTREDGWVLTCELDE